MFCLTALHIHCVHSQAHTCDATVSVPQVRVCFLHVLNEFMPWWDDISSPSFSLTHASKAHTCTHRFHVALSAPLLSSMNYAALFAVGFFWSHFLESCCFCETLYLMQLLCWFQWRHGTSGLVWGGEEAFITCACTLARQLDLYFSVLTPHFCSRKPTSIPVCFTPSMAMTCPSLHDVKLSAHSDSASVLLACLSLTRSYPGYRMLM